MQRKTHRHCISSVECRNMVSITIFQNRKHIGGYRDVQNFFVQNFFLQNLTKNMKKNIGKQECSAENEVP